MACAHKANTSPVGVQKNPEKMELKMKNLLCSQYEEKMKKDGHERLKVQSCVFLVSKSHGFLGVSADGLVMIKAVRPPNPPPPPPVGLVEVKDTKSKGNENLKMVGKGIGNKYDIINKSHLYYYQIQEQAFVGVGNWCVVRGSNKELFQQQVPFIMASWKEKLEHL